MNRCRCQPLAGLPRPRTNTERRAFVRTLGDFSFNPAAMNDTNMHALVQDLGGLGTLASMQADAMADFDAGWDTGQELGFLDKVFKEVKRTVTNKPEMIAAIGDSIGLIAGGVPAGSIGIGPLQQIMGGKTSGPAAVAQGGGGIDAMHQVLLEVLRTRGAAAPIMPREAPPAAPPVRSGFDLSPGIAIAGGLGLLAVAMIAGGRR